MRNIKEIIENLIEAECQKRGISFPSSETVTVSLELTEEEQENFWECDFEEYNNFEIDAENILSISYGWDYPELIRNAINRLEEFNIDVPSGLEECNTIEEIDACIDDLFIENWLYNNSYDFEKCNISEEGIATYEIGNGLHGYMLNNERFATYEEALELLEDN